MVYRAIIVCGLLSLACQAEADTVTLKNGREIHGKLVSETKSAIVLVIAGAGNLRIEKERIATYTENDNFGQSYGRGGRSARRPVAAPRARPPSSPASPATDGADKDSSLPWREQLPPAHSSLNEEQKRILLQNLEEQLSFEKRWLPAATPTAEETAAMRPQFELLGYAGKSGNRGRRDLALKKLVSYGPKVLGMVSESLETGNYYRRLYALRLLAALAADDEAWRFYEQRFELGARLLDCLADQRESLSFGVRIGANATLEKLYATSFGHVSSNEQFRSRNEIEVHRRFSEERGARARVYKSETARRGALFDQYLALWKDGLAEGDD